VRQIALLVGLFGVGLALLGSLLAMFVGSAGLVGGGGLEAGRQVLFGLLAVGAALVGGLGSFVTLFRPRAGALMLLGSAIVGLLAVAAYYVFGSVLLLLGAYFAYRAEKETASSIIGKP
jgi:hypothetical protein